MAENTATVASMDISMSLDIKTLDPHASEKQGSFTIEAASPSEDVDMTTPSVVSLNQSPPTTTTTTTTIKGAKNNIMLGATPIHHQLSMNNENNSLHHFQTNAANPTMYTTPTHNAFVQATLGPLLTDSTATVPSSATADFMALHGHTIGVYEPPRRNSVPTLTADQVEHKRKVSSEEKTLHRQASWSNFSSMATHPMSSLSTTTSLPNLHQIDTATHVDPNMVQLYRSPFSQQQALQQTSHHTLNQALPPSATSSACPSPMPESLMQGSVLNSINSSPIAAAGNKKLGRSDSHTVTLKSQSKRGAKGAGGAERRRRGTSRTLEGRRRSNTDDDAVKQETQDNDKLQPVLSSQNPEGALSMHHHHHHHHAIHGYGSGSMKHEGDGYSPTRSPGGTPMGPPSSMSEDEPFGMVTHSNYSTFANNTLYSLGDPMEHLSGMASRLDTIRLDLKSVAPSDIHKPSSSYDSESSVSGNPNGESPHPSPMPHYEHFAFPTSISTHFMPILNSGFSMDHSGLHHQHALHHHSSSGGPDSASPSSYSSLPSADSSASSASSFQHHHHQGYHPESYQFGANGLHSMGSDLHYPPASPMNEDGSINHHQSYHPHPLHPQSFHHSHHHSDFYDSKVANPQMLHHPFPSLQHPSASALPPHPLMSTSPFTAPGGLNEPLYSSTSSTSSTSSLPGSRATTTPDIINSKGSTTSTKSTSSSASSTTGSTNGASTSTNTNSSSGSSGGGSKHGGSGKHHTCSEIGCSKRFKRLEHLKRHIKTHTLERPFNCPFATCTKKFSRSDNLSQHVKTHQRQMSKQAQKQQNQARAQAQQQQAQLQAVHG